MFLILSFSLHISSLSNKYSNHVYQIFPSNQSFILESAIKLKEKNFVKKESDQSKKWIHSFCTGVWTNIILSISCIDVRSIYNRYNDFQIR